MFHDHLPCCRKKQDFDNSLGGMAAEHFYKLHTDYSACDRKLVKKLVSISMMEVPAVVRIRRSPDSAITIMITMDNTISV